RPRSGLVEFEAVLNPNLLRQGRYLASIAVGKTNWISTIDVIHHFPAFEIIGHPDSGHFPLDNRWGPLYLQFDWISKQLSAFSCQLSAFSCQRSAVSFQLSAVSFQLSAFSRQLSAISASSRKYRAISMRQMLTADG